MIMDAAEQIIAMVAHGAAIATLSINKREEKVLIDSGASTSMISEELAKSLDATYEAVEDRIIWRTAGKTRLTVLGKTEVLIRIGEKIIQESVLVTRDLSHRAILGVDIMRKHKMSILFDGDWLIFGENRVKLADTHKKTVNGVNMWEFRPSQLVQIDKSNMSEEQIAVLSKMLDEYKEIFSKTDEDLGDTEFIHKIRVNSDNPIRSRAYRIPYHQRKIVEDELEKMLRMGVIEKSDGEYGSPVVLVKKGDGSWRFCVDFRLLNAITIKDNFPMGFIDEKLENLSGKDFFFEFRLDSGILAVQNGRRIYEVHRVRMS